jgi:hypothetical protein
MMTDSVWETIYVWATTVAGVREEDAHRLENNESLCRSETLEAFLGFAGYRMRGQAPSWSNRLREICYSIGETFKADPSSPYGALYRQRLDEEIAANDAGRYAREAARLGSGERIQHQPALDWITGCYAKWMTKRYFIQMRTAADNGALRTYLGIHRGAPGSGQRMLSPKHLQMRSVRYAVKRFLLHYWTVMTWESRQFWIMPPRGEEATAVPPGYEWIYHQDQHTSED